MIEFQSMRSVVSFVASSQGVKVLCVISLLLVAVMQYWQRSNPPPTPPTTEHYVDRDGNEVLKQTGNRVVEDDEPKQQDRVQDQVKQAPLKPKPPRKSIAEEIVATEFGKVKVTIVGNRASHARIVTYHDVGTNHRSCFTSTLHFLSQLELLNSFCIYHIDAPGQDEGATDMDSNYKYPTMQELAIQLREVCVKLDIGIFVGFGVGAGSNVLLRYALLDPIRVRSLILAGPKARPRTTGELLLSQYLGFNLNRYGTNEQNQDLIARTLFSSRLIDGNGGIVQTFKDSFNHMSAKNVAKFMASYTNRDQIPKASLHKLASGNISFLFIAANESAGALYFFGQENDQYGIDTIMTELRDTNPAVNASTFAVPSSGRLVTEEKASNLVEPISFFLEACGYYAKVETQ